jgi:catechol 2,3-dioxygenase-like lactoylglutathione lyase family enzyme
VAFSLTEGRRVLEIGTENLSDLVQSEVVFPEGQAQGQIASSTRSREEREPVAMKFAATAIFVEDVPAVLDFYRRAFGLETRHFDATYQYGELQTGETLLAFVSHQLGATVLPSGYQRPDLGGPPFGVYIALLTPDVPAAFAQAVGAGAIPVAEPRGTPWGQTVAHVRGIDGTFIELCSPIGE